MLFKFFVWQKIQVIRTIESGRKRKKEENEWIRRVIIIKICFYSLFCSVLFFVKLRAELSGNKGGLNSLSENELTEVKGKIDFLSDI